MLKPKVDVKELEKHGFKHCIGRFHKKIKYKLIDVLTDFEFIFPILLMIFIYGSALIMCGIVQLIQIIYERIVS